MTAPTEIRPQAGPQEAFLSSDADIVIYGGGAGGGKTWGLLLEPLRHMGNPAFGAVIFRRTSPQITNEGGLWDKSLTLYPLVGAEPRVGSLSWLFPSGASLAFRHLQHESTVLDWQGSEIPLIGIDELTHLTEYQFFYLLSRNRSTCGVRPYVRATCNPDADSWVAAFIAWWIDQDSGLPLPERAGVVRWFVRVNGVLVWGDSPAAIAALHPGIPPKSVTFIPASVHDNPALLKADPGYLANLYALPLVEQERLLGGNWKIRPAAGLIFNRAWFEIVDAAPARGEDCRYWDFAATERELKGPDPDYTAGVLLRRAGPLYYVLDCIAAQHGPADVERLFLATSRQDATRSRAQGANYCVRWEIEPGSAGKREAVRLTQALAGLDARGVKPRGDKLARARPLAAQVQAGNVKVVRGAWNEEFLIHLHHQPDAPHDDIMDAASGAFDDLSGGRPFIPAVGGQRPDYGSQIR